MPPHSVGTSVQLNIALGCFQRVNAIGCFQRVSVIKCHLVPLSVIKSVGVPLKVLEALKVVSQYTPA